MTFSPHHVITVTVVTPDPKPFLRILWRILCISFSFFLGLQKNDILKSTGFMVLETFLSPSPSNTDGSPRLSRATLLADLSSPTFIRRYSLFSFTTTETTQSSGFPETMSINCLSTDSVRPVPMTAWARLDQRSQGRIARSREPKWPGPHSTLTEIQLPQPFIHLHQEDQKNFESQAPIMSARKSFTKKKKFSG